MGLDALLLKVRRGETPLYRALRAAARFFLRPAPPRMPGFLRPLLRVLYETHFFVIRFWRLCLSFYRTPLFQGRCASTGRNLSLDQLPFVHGHTEITIGDDVSIGGQVSILSGRFMDRPHLSIGDRTFIGWNTIFTVNQSITIGSDVLISYDCRISDSDGHPKQADLRARHAPLSPRDIRPVQICSHAWIGNNAHIMKGVTIGEGAVIGANSVVISDIPPYSLAIGNPAEVIMRNYGRPSKPKPAEQG